MNVIANPKCQYYSNCSCFKSRFMMPLASARVTILSTYQSVSGDGQEAVTELTNKQSIIESSGDRAQSLSQQIAFNVLPHIG